MKDHNDDSASFSDPVRHDVLIFGAFISPFLPLSRQRPIQVKHLFTCSDKLLTAVYFDVVASGVYFSFSDCISDKGSRTTSVVFVYSSPTRHLHMTSDILLSNSFRTIVYWFAPNGF